MKTYRYYDPATRGLDFQGAFFGFFPLSTFYTTFLCCWSNLLFVTCPTIYLQFYWRTLVLRHLELLFSSMLVLTTQLVLIRPSSSGDRSGSWLGQRDCCHSLTVHIRWWSITLSNTCNHTLGFLVYSKSVIWMMIFILFLNLLLGVIGFRKWKLGCWCTVNSHVCCWWWWVCCGSELCQEHGTLRGACWSLEHCKI